jgi:hypothetical protein
MPPKSKPINTDVSVAFQEHLTEARAYDDENIPDPSDNIDSASNFPTQEVERFVVSYRGAAKLTGCKSFAVFTDHFSVGMRAFEDAGAKKVVICQTKDPNANNRLVGLVGTPQASSDEKGSTT